MNNNPFANSGLQAPSFGGGNDLRAQLQARGMKTVGEQRAAQQSQQQQQPQQTQQTDTDKIASQLGNQMLRDLGAAMVNPVGFAIGKNVDLAKTLTGVSWLENTLKSNKNAGAANNGQTQQQPEQPQEPEKPQEPEQPKEPEQPNGPDGEVIEYTYKPGDTFGQVILDLGLQTDAGLWGDNGDVAYYTQQLLDQGLWPNGVPQNIPVGTTIRLRKRGTTGSAPVKEERRPDFFDAMGWRQ